MKHAIGLFILALLAGCTITRPPGSPSAETVIVVCVLARCSYPEWKERRGNESRAKDAPPAPAGES